MVSIHRTAFATVTPHLTATTGKANHESRRLECLTNTALPDGRGGIVHIRAIQSERCGKGNGFKFELDDDVLLGRAKGHLICRRCANEFRLGRLWKPPEFRLGCCAGQNSARWNTVL